MNKYYVGLIISLGAYHIPCSCGPILILSDSYNILGYFFPVKQMLFCDVWAGNS